MGPSSVGRPWVGMPPLNEDHGRCRGDGVELGVLLPAAAQRSTRTTAAAVVMVGLRRLEVEVGVERSTRTTAAAVVMVPGGQRSGPDGHHRSTRTTAAAVVMGHPRRCGRPRRSWTLNEDHGRCRGDGRERRQVGGVGVEPRSTRTTAAAVVMGALWAAGPRGVVGRSTRTTAAAVVMAQRRQVVVESAETRSTRTTAAAVVMGGVHDDEGASGRRRRSTRTTAAAVVMGEPVAPG